MRRVPLPLPFLVALMIAPALLPAAAPVASAADPVDSLTSAGTLDLPQLERVVLERNPSLAAMRAAWTAAGARADRAGGWDDPMVEGMVAPKTIGASEVDPAWSVEVSQMIPIFGQRALEGRAARAMARAMAEDYKAMRLEMLRMTREIYFQLYVIARSLEVNAELEGLLGQFRRVALQKYAAGTVGQQDALQADVELAMLDHERVALNRTRRVTQARLRALLRLETSRPLPDPPARLPMVAHALADTGFATAVHHRPEIRAREAVRDAWRAEAALAGRMRLPDLTLIARHDRFMMMEEQRTMVGLGLTIPLWFGKTGAGVRAARAEADRAEWQRLAAIDSVRAELEAARARDEETGHELAIIEARVVPATERALASVRAGYESNRTDFLALLNAERDLARARLSRTKAEAEFHMALADLERAIGIGPEADIPEEPR